jgi:hypothetical protein
MMCDSKVNELSTPVGRLAYQQPTLAVYGSVRELTQGIGSMTGDGGSRMQ